MPRYPLLYVLCLLLFSPLALAAKVRLQVEGLSGDLERNVRILLSTIDDDEVEAGGRFRSRVDTAIRQGLRALGYYAPTITFEFREPPPPSRPVLIALVIPGEPVRIAGVNVVLEGGAREDKDYQQLLATGRPEIGTILNHGAYDSFRNSLSSLALNKGYFDANMPRHQLGVAAQRHEAFWDINFDSGQRYRFGKVYFQGSQIREDYLQNLVPFHEGDDYSADELAELNRRLASTNWFNSVVVSPQFEGAKEHRILPLEAVVTPRTRNTIETGVGYSTDIGPRVRSTWRRPWVNSRGHSLETSTSLSAPEQSLDFSYKMPLLQNPLQQYYLLQTGLKHQNLNDTKSDTMTLNVARFWTLSSGWQRSVNLRWSQDRFTQAGVSNTTMLLYPGVNFNRTRLRGGAMPNWGDSQRYSLDVSDTSWGSDIDFAVIQAQNGWIRSLGERNRFLMRSNLGWIETNDFDRVPPSLRFFAGGDRSVRGYRFRSISPRDSDGRLTGASKMATGSLEYQYNVTGRWWGAVFVDSGDAFNNLGSHQWKTGAGAGVRWSSPIGPVKFDLAVPVGDKEESGLQFYIGLGPEL